MAVSQEMNEITAKFAEFLSGLLGNEDQAIAFSEGPMDVIEAEFGDEDLEGLDLAQALEEAGAGPAPEVEPTDPGLEDLTSVIGQHLQVAYEDNDDIATNLEQNLDVHGEVHGSINQRMSVDEANATGEGSVAVGGGMIDSQAQTQTGDGIQIGGANDGVANVGDNSGQMAGHDATAHNVTSGDNNMVGSQGATVGDGNVNMRGVNISESAVEFGEGDNTQNADDVYDSYNSSTTDVDVDVDVAVDSHDETIVDSYNTDEYTDTSTESYIDNSSYVEDDSITIDQHAEGEAIVGDLGC